MHRFVYRVLPLALVLAAVAIAAAPAAMAGSNNQIKSFFLNAGLQPKAKAKLLFVANPGQSSVKIAVSGMTPGMYDVTLDGAVVDSLRVGSKGKGSVTHKSLLQPKHGPVVPLPYDPRGGLMTIAQTGTVFMSDDVPETPEQDDQEIEIEANLDNLGVIAGDARAEFEEQFGHMQFEVRINDTPPGTYDVAVDGTVVGQIVTGPDGGGKIEFDSVPSTGPDDEGDDDAGLDNLLTFDPRGKTITIGQAGVTQFSVVFPLTGTGDDDQGEDQGGDGEGGDGQGGDSGGEGSGGHD